MTGPLDGASVATRPGEHTQMGWEVEGNYPSKGGVGERAVWFRDSEGNLLGIGQRLV